MGLSESDLILSSTGTGNGRGAAATLTGRKPWAFPPEPQAADRLFNPGNGERKE